MYKIILSFLLLVTFNVFSQSDVFDVARKGTVEEMKLLVKKDKDIVDSKNDNGFSPLILACYKGNIAVAKFLIENSKTINGSSDMGTPLMACAVKGDKQISELLLKKGANPNLSDSKGTTALIYAVQFENLELVNLLLKYKADKNLKDNDGKTAFEFAVFSGNQDIINQLKNN